MRHKRGTDSRSCVPTTKSFLSQLYRRVLGRKFRKPISRFSKKSKIFKPVSSNFQQPKFHANYTVESCLIKFHTFHLPDFYSIAKKKKISSRGKPLSTELRIVKFKQIMPLLHLLFTFLTFSNPRCCKVPLLGSNLRNFHHVKFNSLLLFSNKLFTGPNPFFLLLFLYTITTFLKVPIIAGPSKPKKLFILKTTATPPHPREVSFLFPLNLSRRSPNRGKLRLYLRSNARSNARSNRSQLEASVLGPCRLRCLSRSGRVLLRGKNSQGDGGIQEICLGRRRRRRRQKRCRRGYRESPGHRRMMLSHSIEMSARR